jgi:tetratricopeptide (TPR) repeat protein
LGALGATQAVGLIQMITKVVAPGEWFVTQQPQPFAPMLFPGLGMVGALGGGMGMLGMVGAGPPPAPVDLGGPADIQQANTIEFFPPALALIVRAPSRIHTSITGGLIGGRSKRAEAAAMIERQGVQLALQGREPRLNVAGNQGGVAVAKAQVKNQDEIDPAKVWQEALSREPIEAGLVIATADFLFEAGKFQHAAEFLKANLRQGIVVRPWVYEALAVALEASGGSADEVRRARLSAAALDPTDAQGFLQAARTLAEAKQWDRALAFCRQAALLEPNLAQPYEEALVLAELGKDTRALEWAAGKLVSQDWPADNTLLHKKAQLRVAALAGTLQQEKRGGEAERLTAGLHRLQRRDLEIKVRWDFGSEPAEVEMIVREPCGSVCAREREQSAGGGTWSASDVLGKEPSVRYSAAEAFSGEYEINVRRAWGQPLGGRAHLEITQHLGTPQQNKRLEVVRLDQGGAFKVTLQEGRRTELAHVPPLGAQPRRAASQLQARTGSMLTKLRELAHPDFSAALGPQRPVVASPGNSARPRQSSSEAKVYETGHAARSSSGMNLTTQLRMSADGREANLVMQPVFQAVNAGRTAVNLSVIPGGSNP